jgi:hypothetical protein
MFGIDARREYRLLQAFYDEAQALLAWPEARLLQPVTEVSAWSAARHLTHVALINEKILTGLLRACRGEAELSTEGGVAPAGLFVLVLGRIPRGRARTPAAFEPPEALTQEDVATHLARSRAVLTDLEPHLPELPRLKGRMRHPMLGMLNGQQFLRFARLHARHHLAIAHDVDRQRPGITGASSPAQPAL